MMEKKTASPSIMKLALVLLAAAAVVALVLGLVNHVTKDRIAELAAEKTATAYANVLEAANYEELSGYENNGTITKLVKATDESGAPAGYVAETYFSGAQGMITMVVGVGALPVWVLWHPRRRKTHGVTTWQVRPLIRRILPKTAAPSQPSPVRPSLPVPARTRLVMSCMSRVCWVKGGLE